MRVFHRRGQRLLEPIDLQTAAVVGVIARYGDLQGAGELVAPGDPGRRKMLPDGLRVARIGAQERGASSALVRARGGWAVGDLQEVAVQVVGRDDRREPAYSTIQLRDVVRTKRVFFEARIDQADLGHRWAG